MTPAPDTELLLAQVAAGDADARGRLLARHRDGLARMVACRLDRRLASRVDPSDVVQEVLIEADRKLERYLAERPLPFHVWLRQLAWEHLTTLYRRHVRAGKRSIRREGPTVPALPHESTAALAEQLVESGTTPLQAAVREELRRRVHAALEALPERDREVLVLRHLEHLSVAQTAEVLGISEGAAKVRHMRALERIRAVMGEEPGAES
jgi:RNA polymerase sigma-70 factor (ECF subfamily)